MKTTLMMMICGLILLTTQTSCQNKQYGSVAFCSAYKVKPILKVSKASLEQFKLDNAEYRKIDLLNDKVRNSLCFHSHGLL